MIFSEDNMNVSDSFMDDCVVSFSIPYMDGRCEYSADAHLSAAETESLIQYLSQKLKDANKDREPTDNA